MYVKFQEKFVDLYPAMNFGKKRIVYCASKLTGGEQRAVFRVEEEMLYVCGSPLFPGGQYQDKIVVRQSLTCATYIETQYYAGSQINIIEFYCK